MVLAPVVIGAGFVGLIAVGGVISQAVGAAMTPVSAIIAQEVWAILPRNVIDPQTLAIMRIKGVIDDGQYKALMLKLGFDGGSADQILGSAEQFLDVGTATTARLRGAIGEEEYAEIFRRQGFADDVAGIVFQAAEQILDPATATIARLKGSLSADEYNSIFSRLGFAGDVADKVFQAAEILLPAGELIRAKFRGIIPEERYNSEMARAGFSTESAENFAEVAQFIGGPDDMIRFAVREVFSPEIVEELGLFDEFPERFAEQAAKLGITEETQQFLWGSHWILPSVQQGFEMLHRQATKPDGSTFVIEDMERLLRIQDVMPFFRDLLVQIAFRPFTRVDVRRMNAFGVLSRAETLTAYRDLGFDESKAERMTAFTVFFNTRNDRELTKSEILRAFRRDVIEEVDVIDLLIEIGNSEEATRIIVATEIAKREMDLTDETVDIEVDRFVEGIQSEEELQDVIGRLDLTARQTELILARARKRRRRAEKMPTKADILRWFVNEIIDRESADGLLERLGFIAFFRDLYLSEVEAMPEGA